MVRLGFDDVVARPNKNYFLVAEKGGKPQHSISNNHDVVVLFCEAKVDWARWLWLLGPLHAIWHKSLDDFISNWIQ
jgi:hypothetical protein